MKNEEFREIPFREISRFGLQQAELKSYPPLRKVVDDFFGIRISYTKSMDSVDEIHLWRRKVVYDISCRPNFGPRRRISSPISYYEVKIPYTKSGFRIRNPWNSYTKSKGGGIFVYEWKFRMTKSGEDEISTLAIFPPETIFRL